MARHAADTRLVIAPRARVSREVCTQFLASLGTGALVVSLLALIEVL